MAKFITEPKLLQKHDTHVTIPASEKTETLLLINFNSPRKIILTLKIKFLWLLDILKYHLKIYLTMICSKEFVEINYFVQSYSPENFRETFTRDLWLK